MSGDTISQRRMLGAQDFNFQLFEWFDGRPAHFPRFLQVSPIAPVHHAINCSLKLDSAFALHPRDYVVTELRLFHDASPA